VAEIVLMANASCVTHFSFYVLFSVFHTVR
jgi:hypothetical protein